VTSIFFLKINNHVLYTQISLARVKSKRISQGKIHIPNKTNPFISAKPNMSQSSHNLFIYLIQLDPLY